MRIIFFILLIICSANYSVFGYSDTEQIKASRISEEIELDGILNESVWQDSYYVDNFIQRDPIENGKPSQKTVVRIAYNDESIFIGAHLMDSSPDSIIANLGRRDAYLPSDKFYCFLDSYNDKRSGFFFGLNAGGTIYDGILYNDSWDDDSWDGVWEGKVNRNSEGWTAEMRIPFSQLRFQDHEKQTWGVNFRRDIQRNNERVFLVFTPKNSTGFVSRFPELVGIENIESSKQLELLPYFRTKAEYISTDAENPFHDGSKYLPDAGIDLKYGLSSNLTLDMTINPDFGQVEVDPAVVNLGDVETYYSEKRPFFIEGSSIFNFGYGGAQNFWGFNWSNPNFFYSRRIGRHPQGSWPDNDYANVPEGAHIIGAGKITGKIGNNWNVGTIHALTKREMGKFYYNGEHSESEVEPLTYYGIFRAQKEMNDSRQGLGMISTLTSRSFDQPSLKNDINQRAVTLGLDGWSFLDSSKTWVISGWAGATHITGSQTKITDLQQNSRHYFQRPDADHVQLDTSATSLSGYAARLWLIKEKGNWVINSAMGIISPGFDVNDMGFMWRADQINNHFGVGRKWTEPGKLFRQVNLIGALFHTFDFGGNSTAKGLWHLGYFQFLNYFQLEYILGYYPERFNNNLTRGGPLTIGPTSCESSIWIRSDDRNPLVFSLSSYGYNSKYSSWGRNLWFDAEWKPASNLSFSIGPEIYQGKEYAQWVDSFDDALAVHTYGKRYVFAEFKQTQVCANIRLNWTFTPKLSLQLYMQPLISHGDYVHFKELAKVKTYDFNDYQDDQTSLNDGVYKIDPDGSGDAEPLIFDNPDFHFKSLRGNAVLRWEYRPGSTFYFVWTQSRINDQYDDNFAFKRSVSRLLNADSDNIFMIKWTYWWSL